MNRRNLMAAAFVTIAALSTASIPAHAGKDLIYTTILSNAAVGGYDPIAYFTDSKPVKGKSAHTMEWKGADWYFVSAANLAKFKAMPESYAPQYGGYCAYGVSQNAAVKGDPLLWKIVDGKLYLNINKQVVKIWNKDVPGYITKANAKWPNVLN